MSVIEPDTKDWTWVLDRPCPECGFVAGDVSADRLAPMIRDNATAWQGHLRGPMARQRPRPEVWSTLEYGAHVRDVHRVFAERVRLMLAEEVPRFPNWDQDATAVEERYDLQDPDAVADELLDAATGVADLYDAVPPGAWGRRGLRSNGSEFSIETLGRYHLHDVVHHLWDVSAATTAYGVGEVGESVRSVLDRFLALLPPDARVLELGRGEPVPRSPEAPYDGVRTAAEAVDAAVLRSLVEVTRAGGLLHLALEESGADEAPVREAVTRAGWEIVEVGHSDGWRGEVWLDVLARKP